MVFTRSALRLSRPASSLLSQRAANLTPRGAFAAQKMGGVRTLTATSSRQGKVLLVLYDVSGGNIIAESIGKALDANNFSQGKEHAQQEPRMLGTTENELGIRKWLEDQGHTLVTTSDKDTENSKFDQELVDAEVIITTP